jgi:MFS family permease
MTAFLYGALSGALLFFPLNLIQVQGYSETSAGFTMLPVSICLAVLSPLMGRVMGRIGARLLMAVGPFLVGIGFLLLSLPGLTAGVGDYWTAYFPGILCIGLGMGLTVTPLTTTVMSSVSTDSAGTASGVNNAVTRSAQVLMIAIFTIIATNAFANNLTNRLASLPVSAESRTQMLNESSKLGNVPIPENLDGAVKTDVSQAVRLAFAEMFRVMMLVAAALCWISAMISALTIRRVPTATPNVATGNTA